MRKQTRDKALAMRCQVVLLASEGPYREAIARAVGFSVSWVQRIVQSFRLRGPACLYDGRADNGQIKLDEPYLSVLYDVVDGSPLDYGYPRPTWTQELLCNVMAELTGVRIHRGTMSRALAKIGARHGRPKPTVACPWSKRARRRRKRQLQRLIEALPADEAVFYEDEVDIHLNPKIGPDWMNRGQQKQVMTPGQNQKRYLAGALDARTGLLAWCESDRKNSLLFIDLLHRLVELNPQAKVIHLILDNFKIHDSRATQAAVQALGGRVKLHFLPPYCPDDNRIERVWLDLHANVTRNHRCAEMKELMREVRRYLRTRNASRRRELSTIQALTPELRSAA
jgi:transposase